MRVAQPRPRWSLEGAAKGEELPSQVFGWERKRRLERSWGATRLLGWWRWWCGLEGGAEVADLLGPRHWLLQSGVERRRGLEVRAADEDERLGLGAQAEAAPRCPLLDSVWKPLQRRRRDGEEGDVVARIDAAMIKR